MNARRDVKSQQHGAPEMDMSAEATSGGRFSKPLPSDSSTSDIANDDWLLLPELVGIGNMRLDGKTVEKQVHQTGELGSE